jgi:hypothetical protein
MLGAAEVLVLLGIIGSGIAAAIYLAVALRNNSGRS